MRVHGQKMVHGIWNTVPILTRIALRYKGSLQPEVRSTASIFRAAAERNIAPMFVGLTTFSRMAIRLAPALNLCHRRKRPAAHGTEQTTRQSKACQLREHLPGAV